MVGYTLDKHNRQTRIYTHTYALFRVTNSPNLHVFGLWKKTERPERTRREIMRSPHRKAPARNQTLIVLVTTSPCHPNKYHKNLKCKHTQTITHTCTHYMHVICIPLGERIRRSKPNEVKSEETELCLVISQKCMPFFSPPKLKAVLCSQTALPP